MRVATKNQSLYFLARFVPSIWKVLHICNGTRHRVGSGRWPSCRASAHFVPQVAAVSSSDIVVHLHRDNAASGPVWPCMAVVGHDRHLLVLDPDFMALFTWSVKVISCHCMSSILSLSLSMSITFTLMFIHNWLFTNTSG